MDIVLIPAYQPDKMLIELTRQLHEKGFYVLVVNDGSGDAYASIFEQVQPFAYVLTHSHNKGKGAALKTGMKYVRQSLPDGMHVITCDADGQHKIEDVVRVQACLHNGQKFVLTVREFENAKIPFRSLFGNALSRVVYTLLTNRYLSDNQSGLRGYHRSHLDWLIAVEKNNYDYEMNVLFYAAKKNIYIATLPIEALYLDNNSSSHFNPVLDTLRIYKSLFRLAGSTFIAFLVAEILVGLLSFTLGYERLFLTLPGVGAVGCLTAIFLNQYVVLRRIQCYDYWVTLIYTVISYFVYTLLCALWMFIVPGLPLLASFNLTFFVCLPLRYYLHKFIFIASRYKE